MQKFNDAAASRLSGSSVLRRFRLSRATTEQAGSSRAIMQARLEPTNPAPTVPAIRFVF